VNALTDQQLLREYAASRSDSAFRELVRRHIDLVHSAARRLVRDSHTAEDVTQAVFTALSKDARKVSSHPVLAGWLHKTTRHLSTNVIRADVRRRVREQQAIAMNEQAGPASEPEPLWTDIASHLDAVLCELSESDRDAVILRYFEKRSAKEIAATLGITAEAAQKRVNRAIERLRESFARRGVTGSAAGLSATIGSNAIQAAPSGLAAAIAGAVLTSSVTTTTTTTTVMIILQKILIPVAAVALAGAWAHQNNEASRLRAGITPSLQAHAANSSASGASFAEGGTEPVETGDSAGVGAGRGGSGGGISIGGVRGFVGVSGVSFDTDPEPVSLDDQGRPTTAMVETLELSDAEVTALETAVRQVRAEASADFKKRVTLTSSGNKEDGYHYFYRAPAREDRGKVFFDALTEAFTETLGENRGQRFRKAMKEHLFLGGMGKYDIDFDFRFLPEASGPLGNMAVHYKSYDPGSSEIMGTSSDMIRGFEEKFGKVFEFPEPPEPAGTPEPEAVEAAHPESR
jgi:RNA polymerase sigma factor (sigma-70 family)